MKNYQTDQEAFWAGEFGDAYVDRSRGDRLVAARTAFLAAALRTAGAIGSAVEFGCNVGLNLRGLRHLLPAARLSGIEINERAAEEARKIGDVTVYHASIVDFRPSEPADLSFVCGVLIHLNPDVLPQVYDGLHAASRRYVLVAEYYNPTPVGVPYRGHPDRLFKRDFAGEMLDRFADLRLADYGFRYHRDPNFPMDDVSWFLLEKR